MSKLLGKNKEYSLPAEFETIIYVIINLFRRFTKDSSA